MRTRDKYIRVRFETWKELRALFKGKPNESMADYVDRLIEHIIVMGETYNLYPNPRYPNARS